MGVTVSLSSTEGIGLELRSKNLKILLPVFQPSSSGKISAEHIVGAQLIPLSALVGSWKARGQAFWNLVWLFRQSPSQSRDLTAGRSSHRGNEENHTTEDKFRCERLRRANHTSLWSNCTVRAKDKLSWSMGQNASQAQVHAPVRRVAVGHVCHVASQAGGKRTVYLTDCVGTTGSLSEQTRLSSPPHKFWNPHSKEMKDLKVFRFKYLEPFKYCFSI